METGNSIAKSGKALVRNGTCWWEEATLLEPIWISRDDASQDIQECLYKFVVAMVDLLLLLLLLLLVMNFLTAFLKLFFV